MFVYSVRASTIKLFAVIILTFSLLCGVLVYSETKGTFAVSVNEAYNFSDIKTNEDRIEFLAQFGIEVTGEASEESFTMPENFDRVLLGYNEIQKAQGFDLSKYAKKKVTRYTYELPSYRDYDGTVYVTILVYRDKVIGGDVSSADPDGFVKGIIEDSDE